MLLENKKIGIVTVLYNSASVVEEFFQSLNRQTYDNFILYVINNNSPDDSLQKSREMALKVDFETVFIDEPENWGVAKGNNIGIRKALDDNCDYVLLSNNDTVLQANSIEVLLQGLLANKVKLAVPKIFFYKSDLLNFAGGDFTYIHASGMARGYAKKDAPQYNKQYLCSYAPTCFMLIDCTLFDEIGLMDENYFVYFDDTDFAYRAWKAGYMIAYIPESTIEHKESVCTGGILSDFYIKYFFRNMVYFSLKHHNKLRQIIILGYTYLKLPVRLLTGQGTKRVSKIYRALNSGFKYYKKAT